MPNPFLAKTGTTYLLGSGEELLSSREAAQNSKVFNPETNTFENWTPNDDDKRGLIDYTIMNFEKGPLVLAK